MTSTTWTISQDSTISGSTWTSNSSSWNGAKAKNGTACSDASFTFNANKTGAMYLGLDSTTNLPVELSYSVYIDYANLGNAYATVNGSTVATLSGFSHNDVIKFENASGTIKIYKNGVLYYTFTATTTDTLYQTVQGVATAEVTNCEYTASGGSGGGGSGGGSGGSETTPIEGEGAIIDYITYLNTRVPK